MTRWRHAKRALTAAALLGALLVGCQTTPTAPGPPPVKAKAEVKGQTVDARTAARLRLISQYQRALVLHSNGQTQQALGMLKEVVDGARQWKLTFEPRMEANLKRVAAGQPPEVDLKPQAVAGAPARPPAPAPSPLPTKTIPLPAGSPGRPAKRAPKSMAGRVLMPALRKPGMADKLILVNFDEVDIRVILKTVSDLTGINFLVDDAVRGKVTLISPTKIKLKDLFAVLESILEVKGYAAVPSGDLVKIVPRNKAAQRNLLTRVGGDPAHIPENDAVVTQMIPLRYAEAREMAGIIAPLVGPSAHMTTYAQTNMILVTDTSSNIHHIATIIRELDVAGSQEDATVIGLKYASAKTLAQQITEALTRTGRTASASVARPARSLARARAVSSSSAKGGFKILADDRTNSLIVLATPKDTQAIRELVRLLDVERPRDGGNIHVVYLRNATAKEVVKSLTSAVQKLGKVQVGKQTTSIQITADEGTNSLIVIATPQDFKVIEEMVAKLDIVREQILVEMRILEASQSVLRDLGVEWSSLDPASSSGVRGFGFTDYGIRVEATSGDLQGLAVGAYKLVDDQTKIAAIIKALESNTKVNILSQPHILATNHQEATITVGENVPYVKQSRITESDFENPTAIKTYEYKDVGVILKITPHVSQGGLTRMEIDSKFTKLIQSATGLSADTPTTAIREAKTVVTIANGATVVIGGLIRDDVDTKVVQVPLLGDIPWIGALFRRTETTTQKTNLLFFITPYVLATRGELERMTRVKEAEMREKVKAAKP